MLDNFANAFSFFADPVTLALLASGVLLGLLFGIIPGLTATLAVILLVPMTYGMDPSLGISILIGVYIGGISGGLVSAILLGMPGTPSSITTAFDGFPMTQQGQAKRAITAAIVSNLFKTSEKLLHFSELSFVTLNFFRYSTSFSAFFSKIYRF